MEVLIAAVLLATMLVPLLESLHGASLATTAQEELAQQHLAMNGKLEDLLAQSFGALDAAALAAGNSTTPTSYSDLAGTANRCLVYLARYDGDNADADGDPFTGVDEDLIWLRVMVENTALSVQSLSTR